MHDAACCAYSVLPRFSISILLCFASVSLCLSISMVQYLNLWSIRLALPIVFFSAFVRCNHMPSSVSHPQSCKIQSCMRMTSVLCTYVGTLSKCAYISSHSGFNVTPAIPGHKKPLTTVKGVYYHG